MSVPSVQPGNGLGSARTTMLALAYILCERRPRDPAPGEWEAEARFLLPTPTAFAEGLDAAGLGDRGHPTDLGVQVSTDILFEDGDITGQTIVLPTEIPVLMPHVDAATRLRLQAWRAFALALEDSGQDARLVIWFIR
ncbi:hypothetical protein [Deinococcus yunweiensis]|uniref:hypothetical protein n=1 Tax=Deinococcus yunweiensis TaxID=367282 RepID=UPI00398E6647